MCTGAWGSVVVKGTALPVGRSRDRFPVVSLGICSVAPPDRTMCPGIDLAPQNEYQEFLLTTYHPRSAERQENPAP
jgi:hypothetical protein